MINHNIRRVIFDKVAFNQWKGRIKNVNREYHQDFKESFDNTSLDCCIYGPINHCACEGEPRLGGFILFNKYRLGVNKYIYRIVKTTCSICGFSSTINRINTNHRLPKNY